MSAIAKSYWRSILRGVRTFEAVLDSQKDAVRELVRADVGAGTLSAGEYQEIIGEDYASGGDADP